MSETPREHGGYVEGVVAGVGGLTPTEHVNVNTVRWCGTCGGPHLWRALWIGGEDDPAFPRAMVQCVRLLTPCSNALDLTGEPVSVPLDTVFPVSAVDLLGELA